MTHLCVDCIYHKTSANGARYFHTCRVHRSPVTGEVVERDCEQERVGESETRCGAEGRYWVEAAR